MVVLDDCLLVAAITGSNILLAGIHGRRQAGKMRGTEGGSTSVTVGDRPLDRDPNPDAPECRAASSRMKEFWGRDPRQPRGRESKRSLRRGRATSPRRDQTTSPRRDRTTSPGRVDERGATPGHTRGRGPHPSLRRGWATSPRHDWATSPGRVDDRARHKRIQKSISGRTMALKAETSGRQETCTWPGAVPEPKVCPGAGPETCGQLWLDPATYMWPGIIPDPEAWPGNYPEINNTLGPDTERNTWPGSSPQLRRGKGDSPRN